MLSSEEAARRLGVKVPTLYAYVSRGLVASHPAPGGRRSLFDVEDIERLARRAQGGRTVEARLATVTTSITRLGEGGPVYRGTPAVELAATSTFEAVAERLWGVDEPGRDGHPSAPGAGWEAHPLDPPSGMAPTDLLRWAVVVAAPLEGLRSDLRPPTVVRTARRLIATMAEVLARAAGNPDGTAARPMAGSPSRADVDHTRHGDRAATTDPASATARPTDFPPTPSASVAAALTAALAPDPTPELARAVDTALVLLADHELATSTMAVRVAASTRADPGNALLAGLGTMAGPLHGGASGQVHALLDDAGHRGAAAALDDVLRWQRLVPGFGHAVYTEADPRFGVLLAHALSVASPAQAQAVRAVLDLGADHGLPPPNVDLALGALTWVAGMAPEAGGVVFTVARMAGWIAHYLEELRERPLRFRARAVYASDEPAS